MTTNSVIKVIVVNSQFLEFEVHFLVRVIHSANPLSDF